MISNIDAARKVSDLLLSSAGQLNESVEIVKSSCPKEESERYSRLLAGILGEILLEILNPLYSEHPELKPDALE